MGFLTWANRMLNISTSGRWVTIAMLGATFLPLIITADNLISAIAGLFGAEEGAFDFIPFNSYNYFVAGLTFTLLFWALTTSISEVFLRGHHERHHLPPCVFAVPVAPSHSL